MSNINSSTVRKYAPIYEGWGTKRTVSDYRDTDFVEFYPAFNTSDEALRYSETNRDNYPYCTTGRVALVEITTTVIAE